MSYGVSLVKITEKIACVITTPRCIMLCHVSWSWVMSWQGIRGTRHQFVKRFISWRSKCGNKRCSSYVADNHVIKPGARPINDISLEFEIRSQFIVLWFKGLNRSQRNFPHVTTMLLSWRVLNVFVIRQKVYEQEHNKISVNFEFDRNVVRGTGAWTLHMEARLTMAYATLWCDNKST